MKQRNRILTLILACCLCAALMTGCFLFPEKEPVEYAITIDENIAHGSVECEIAKAKAGETITVVANADENYQLVAITVNGEIIEGDSFVMPEKDVVIGATFGLAADLIEAVPAGAIEIKAQSAGGAYAKGQILLTFGDDGVKFEAYVEDATIVDRDGVAILFSRELPMIAGLLPEGQTIKVSVNALGEAAIYATDAAGVLQRADLKGVTAEFGTWSRNGEKLDGYHVEILVPYSVLGTTAADAKGNITVCPLVYSAYGSLPAQSASLNEFGWLFVSM